jgi:hypothetical protein
VTRCRYLGRRGIQCTAEVVDDQGEIMLCQHHLARAVELLANRGFTVLLPASSSATR